MLDLTPFDYAFIAGAMFLAGMIKGLIGFGLPLIAVSLLSSFLDVGLSLALIILPIVVTNFWQGLTSGRAKAAVKRFWGLLLMLTIGIWIGSRIVASIDPDRVLLILACVVLAFALLELTTVRITIAPRHESPAGFVAGFVGGLIGGLTTTYGPFLVAYMSALRMSKEDFVGSAGVVWFWASLSLLVAYGTANILTPERALVSAGCVLPALLGMHIGSLGRRRLNEELFRRLLLIALIIAGLNLLRRALM